MTTYVNDFPGTRIQLFHKELAVARVEAAKVARTIRMNMEKRRIKIDPSAIFLFGVKSTRDRVERFLFRGMEQEYAA